MTLNRLAFTLTVLALAFSACSPTNLASLQPTVKTLPQADLATSSTLIEPTQDAVAVPASSPVANSPAAVGPNPENVPQGYNPLTGLPVADPSTLKLPAVLVSITNFPPSARPQAGLSFSPWVYEIYIAEGMTRYLAAFYGDFPKAAVSANSGAANAPQAPSAEVGPVRSGRLPYVYIRDAFQDSCLVYAGATEQIRAQLRGCAMVFGSDSTNINSAMLDVTRMQKIAEQNKRPTDNFNYTGNLFTSQAQSQGAPASQIDVYYSYLNQAQWKFDSASGAYLKFDDFADGSGKFKPATDRLTGKQLAFSNVVVLYAQHTVLNPYIIDINLKAGEKGRAVIFRDGQKFDAYWTTVNGDYEKSTGLRRPLRLVDANGNPFALKPGQTWIHTVTLASLVQDKGAGQWRLRFYAPAGAK